MVKYLLSVLLILVGFADSAQAAFYKGMVVEVTADTITIQQGGVRTFMFVISNELMTNTTASYPGTGFTHKLSGVKKGSKVDIDWVINGGKMVCVCIDLENPDDTGIVTEVGKDTITLRSDKGCTITYKVVKELVDNSRDPSRYSVNYESRFAQVKAGCRIEVCGYIKGGEFIISGLDVKPEKDK